MPAGSSGGSGGSGLVSGGGGAGAGPGGVGVGAACSAWGCTAAAGAGAAGDGTFMRNAEPQDVQRTFSVLPASFGDNAKCFLHFGQLNFIARLNTIRVEV